MSRAALRAPFARARRSSSWDVPGSFENHFGTRRSAAHPVTSPASVPTRAVATSIGASVIVAIPKRKGSRVRHGRAVRSKESSLARTPRV